MEYLRGKPLGSVGVRQPQTGRQTFEPTPTLLDRPAASVAEGRRARGPAKARPERKIRWKVAPSEPFGPILSLWLRLSQVEVYLVFGAPWSTNHLLLREKLYPRSLGTIPSRVTTERPTTFK